MSPYFVLLLSLLKLVSALTDSDKTCIAQNAGTLDNSFMIGTWYEVYKFSMWLNLPPSRSCPTTNITRATADDLVRFREAYGDVEPFKFDSTAVISNKNDGDHVGMLTGGDQVKFYAWDPKNYYYGSEEYQARVYKKVNEDYVLFNSCVIPTMKSLMSRRRDQTEAELQQIIATIEDVQRLETQRLCSPV